MQISLSGYQIWFIQFSLAGLSSVHYSHLFNRSPSTKSIIWLSDKDTLLPKEQIRRFLTDWQVHCQCIAHICSTDLSLPERVQSTHLRKCSMIFLISIYLNYPTVQFLFWIKNFLLRLSDEYAVIFTVHSKGKL